MMRTHVLESDPVAVCNVEVLAFILGVVHAHQVPVQPQPLLDGIALRHLPTPFLAQTMQHGIEAPVLVSDTFQRPFLVVESTESIRIYRAPPSAPPHIPPAYVEFSPLKHILRFPNARPRGKGDGSNLDIPPDWASPRLKIFVLLVDHVRLHVVVAISARLEIIGGGHGIVFALEAPYPLSGLSSATQEANTSTGRTSAGLTWFALTGTAWAVCCSASSTMLTTSNRMTPVSSVRSALECLCGFKFQDAVIQQ
eukprot:2056546-Rhodomonas_salina.3